MKAALETYTAIILIVLASTLGAIYITISLNHNLAQTVHSSVVSEIEDGDFAPEVIAEQERLVHEILPSAELRVEGAPTEVYNVKLPKSAKVTLVYYYDCFLFINPLEYEITGYAR